MSISQYFAASGLIGQAEWSLTDNTAFPSYVSTSGVYQLIVNTSGLQAGDEFTLKIYERATNIEGDLSLPVYTSTFVGPQSPQVFASPALILGNLWDFTLDGSGVTGRNFFWSIRRLS